MIHRYTLLAVAIASSLFLVACNKSDPAKASAAGAGAAQQMPPPVVNVMPVQFQTVPLVKKLAGRAVAMQEAVVVPQATGIITQQLFREGSMVKQGQALYRLNPDNYTSALAGSKAQLAQSQAGVQTAQANHANAVAALRSREAELRLAQKKYQRLIDIAKVKETAGAISIQEIDIAKTQVETAQAAVANAMAQIKVAEAGINSAKASVEGVQQTINSNQLNVNRTTVTAPLSGYIRKSNVDVGALVTAGQTQMTTIANLNGIYVDISQSSAEMLEFQQQVQKGKLATPNSAAVRLILADGSTYPLMGQLSFADQVVDKATGAVTLRAIFKNNGMLLPGMFVNAEVLQGEVPNAVLLPQSAIIRTPKGETTVYIVGADNKIQVRPVKVNGTHQGQWIVTEGLKQGENVVILGGAKVKPDQQVEVKPYVASEDNLNNLGNKPATAVSNAPTNASATSAPSSASPSATATTTTTTTTQKTVVVPASATAKQ